MRYLPVPAGYGLAVSRSTVTIMGETHAKELTDALATATGNRLKPRPWQGAPSMRFRGVKDSRKSLFGLEYPVCLGGDKKGCGTHRILIIEGDAPLLVGLTTLKTLDCLQDYDRDRLWVPRCQKWLPRSLAPGDTQRHMLPIFDFPSDSTPHFPPCHPRDHKLSQ